MNDRSRILAGLAALSLGVLAASRGFASEPGLRNGPSVATPPPITATTPLPAHTVSPVLQPSARAELLAATTFALPTNLALATQGLTCAQHMNLDAQAAKCDPAIAAHKVVLIWTVAPCANAGGCVTPIDGYGVEKSASGPSGSYAYVASQSLDPKQTGIILAEKTDDVAGTCFHVYAYKGELKSPPSAPYCVLAAQVVAVSSALPTAKPPKRVVIENPGVMTRFVTHNFDPDHQRCQPVNPGATPAISSGEFIVGFRDDVCRDTYDSFQAGLRFYFVGVDLTRPIASASLNATVVTAHYNNGSQPREVTDLKSCTLFVGYAENDDWLNSNPAPTLEKTIPFELFQQLPYPDTAVNVDVTSMVKAWQSGRAYHGIVLTPLHTTAEQGWQPFSGEDECVTLYRNPTLTITFGD